jgi:thiol-disulfide isomerase/thioredoxin
VLSLTLGPIALPMAPVLLLAALWLASLVAGRLARRGAGEAAATRAQAASDALLHASLAGLLVARVAHVVIHADAYAASPWSVLDLRDGGWHTATGAAAGIAWLAVRSWRGAPLRVPLAAAAVTAAVAWGLGGWALGRHDTPPLPDLAVTDLATGRTLTLHEAARGRPVVINLWASWCGPCRQEMPVLAAAQRHHPDVGFLFVNQGESAAAVRAYLAGLGAPLHEVLLDPGSRLGPAVGSRGLPTTVFHDVQGRRVDAHFGVLNAAALESRLRALRGTRP